MRIASREDPNHAAWTRKWCAGLSQMPATGATDPFRNFPTMSGRRWLRGTSRSTSGSRVPASSPVPDPSDHVSIPPCQDWSDLVRTRPGRLGDTPNGHIRITFEHGAQAFSQLACAEVHHGHLPPLYNRIT